MDKFDRIHLLHRHLQQARYPVAAATLMERLECSRPTLSRLIGYMRDFLGAPIESDHQHGGYRYAEAAQGRYELPGLWFSPAELFALVSIRQLLTGLQPGLLEAELAPLGKRIDVLLAREQFGSGEAAHRVRILAMAGRRVPDSIFQRASEAMFSRRQLAFTYHARTADDETERTVCPQRLTRYRDNWYLDAWCHKREGLRTFALEQIHEPRLLSQPATDLDDQLLDAHYAEAYGIFSGPAVNRALLRFTPHRARWIADETWHPEQRGRLLPDGAYELEIPYGRADELILDVLRYGPDVEVIGPAELRREVAGRLRRAVTMYDDIF
jgi:predicted DNA-binding transcriptional regulator YafY